jgi:hypothetical protein
MTGQRSERNSAFNIHPMAGALIPVYSVLISTGLTLFHAAWYDSAWYNVIGFFIAALGLTSLAFVSYRIWRFLVVPLFRSYDGWLMHLSVLPFSVFGSAIGYTIGMLVARKTDLLVFWDQPVRLIVQDGALLGCLVLGLHEAIQRVLRRAKFAGKQP